MNEFKQGEVVEVTNYPTENKWKIREFIGYSNKGYVCWNKNKDYIATWAHIRKVKPHKKLKEFAEKYPKCKWEWSSPISDYIEWNPCSNEIDWDKNYRYRIRDNISLESYEKFENVILAWWSGAKIEYYTMSNSWKTSKYPIWKLAIKYRIKPKTIYEFMVKHFNDWYINNKLLTLKEIKEIYDKSEYKLTGRSWKVKE